MNATAQKPVPPSVERATDVDLPEGWAAVQVQDLFESFSGGTPSRNTPEYWGGAIPWLSSGDIKTSTIQSASESITKAGLLSSAAKLCRPGSVVIVVRSGILAHTLPAAVLSVQAAINQDIKCFDSGQNELNAWLALALRSSANEILALNRDGTTVQSVKYETLKQFSLRVQPLAEQKRTIAKVEELLTQVNAARDRLAKVPKILKRFRQAVLAAACSGRLTEDWRNEHPNCQSAMADIADAREKREEARIRRDVPDTVEVPEELSRVRLPSTWVMKSVAELIRSGALLDVKDGNHGANHPKAADFSETGLPFITAAQVTNYNIDYSGAPKVTGKALQCLRVGFAKAGDAVLTHKGTVGRAALSTQACVLTPQTTYYRCNQEVLNANYLVYFFTSPQFYQQLAEVMSQTTRDFVPISGQYHLFLFVPPDEEQHEIVRRVEALFKLADAIEKRLEAASKRANKLTQAILAKAFRGELVPSEAELARREGRSYEPASALLERIRTEREAKSDDKTKLNQHRRGRKIAQRA